MTSEEAGSEMPEIPEEEERRLIILDTFGLRLSRQRSEAIKGRVNLGIEDIWREDEEYYEGIDDNNRGENSAWRSKPAGQAALKDEEDTGSTVFVNITAPYCDAASARVGDMLMPTDDKGWQIKTTPVPGLISLVQGKETPEIDDAILQSTNGNAEEAANIKTRIIMEEQAKLDDANEKARKAEKRIEDWHVEGQYHSEMRLVIEDAAKTGTGVLKGPIPDVRKNIAYINGKIVIQKVVQPVSRRVDYRNCFPDPTCGNNIHDGSYHWERDDINRKKLLNLKDGNYIDSQIDKVVAEGPMRAIKDFKEGDHTADQLGLTPRTDMSMFEIWYFYGMINKKDLIASGCECPEDMPDYVNAQVTMVNNRVIKATINHLDTGEFPYDYMVWKERRGMPFGTGIARAIRVAQDIVNGATRNMMDNAGLAGGPMWIYTDGKVEPEDGNYELAPRKGWRRSADSIMSEDSKIPPFEFLIIPMLQPELQRIVEFGLKIAEDVTGMPMLLQGQQGQAPDTVGGMQIINNNASTVMRRVARLFDDLVTEPHVRRYYEYLLQYGKDDEKGEFVIDARGSSALVERDIQSQAIMGMGQMILNPVFGKDPKKWMSEYMKAQHLDAKKFDYDDQEWQQIVEGMAQAQQAPPDQKLEVAQLQAEAKAQEIQMKLEFEREQKELDRNIEIEFKTFEQEIALQQLQNQKDINTDTLKKDLAETVMKLKMQEKLSRDKPTARSSVKPPTEPAGRAKEGESYQG
jgi:hypothetical protein